MPIPTNFSPTEHFQDTIRRLFNPRIRQHFQDIDADDDLSSDRGNLKRACLHQEDDAMLLTIGRFLLFLFFKLEQLFNLVALKEGQENELETQYHIQASNHPRIIINFAQDGASVPKDRLAITAESSFRLIEYVSWKRQGDEGNVINKTELISIARRIESEFANFSFQKGDELYIYSSPADGFFGSKVFARNKAEAEKVLKKMCAVAQKNYKPELLKLGVTPNRRSKNRPTEKAITFYGLKNEPVWRPTAVVRYENSVCEVGTNSPVVLHDVTGFLQNPLVK